MPEAEREGLPVPDSARDATEATELLRLWFADGRPVTVCSPALPDPRWWGVMLVDAMVTVARSYGATGQMTQEQAFDLMKTGLTGALASPEYVPPARVAPIVPSATGAFTP